MKQQTKRNNGFKTTELSMKERAAPLFRTRLGDVLVGDSLDVLDAMETETVDLVVTSPPFALLREKSYGNADQSDYVEWLCRFAPRIRRVLKPTGSYVIDLGGAYQRGKPVRSLHQYRMLIRHVDDLGFHLAEEFFWHNPSKLPSPIEWVNKRKIRVKDTVNIIWWLGKTEWPRADVSRVLAPYSERMKTLLKDPERFYTPKDRPSGHQISAGFAKDNGGAIPPNLLQFPNSESNGRYLQLCKSFGVDPHPARFPIALPDFFIKFLTNEGDLVLDIFGGSGTTGEAAERLGRRWRTIEIDPTFARASLFRFVGDRSEADIKSLLDAVDQGRAPAVVLEQPGLFDAVG